MDPRRIRSRNKVQDALRQTLAETELNDIRIDELCQLAGISRVTFYANFRSVQCVLDAYLDDVVTRLEERLNAVAPSPGPHVPPEEKLRRTQVLLTWLFTEIGAKDARMRALLDHSQPRLIEDRFMVLFRRIIEQNEARRPGEPWPSAAEREIGLHFFIGAVLSLLRLWMANPGQYTARQLGEIGARLLTFGRAGLQP